MSFLAPLFLLGALAVALPVVFHLIRRTTRERRLFSSLMFLQPTPPKVTRRSRLEHLLLLALRCAALVLLAIGFSRPFIKRALSGEPVSAVENRLVILLDVSASMRRANLWADARDQADALLRKSGPADAVAVFLFARQVTQLVSLEDWKNTPAGERVAMAKQRLATASPGWDGTHLGNAVIAAVEALADISGKAVTGRRQVAVISDFQEGSHLDQLQGYEWPKGIELSVTTLKPRHAGNAGLQLATDTEEVDLKASPKVRVRVNNASDSKREQFKVGWSRADGRGFASPATEVYVPAGQSRIVTLEATSGSTNAPGPDAAMNRVWLQGDEEDFDNSVFVIPPETARFRVVCLGGDSEKDARRPLYFLEHAFQETRKQAVEVVARGPGTTARVEVEGAALVVVMGPLAETETQALRDWVAGGRTLLFALQTEADGRTLARLAGQERLDLSEARVANYAMLAEIDFRHPLFAPFADPRFSDFTRIHFWKYRRLDPAALPGGRVLAKFDSGDPAILEVPVGKGRIVVLTSSWHPEDSQFALSTKFVPFLYGLLEQESTATAAPAQYHVGDAVPLPSLDASAGSLSITVPDGSQLKLGAGQTNFSQTTMPGIYTIATVQPQKPVAFAVNLDAMESRTAPMPADELERLGAPVTNPTANPAHETAHQAGLRNAELESRQKLWRWLIVATLAVLLVETWLAARTARQVRSGAAL